MSIISAPSFSIFSAVVTISSTPLNRLPPKKESGVALMIPITSGFSITSNRPLQLSVNIQFLFVIFGAKDREKVNGEWPMVNKKLYFIKSKPLSFKTQIHHSPLTIHEL
jgi:hypothetical protein